MQKIITALFSLQELALILEETKILHRDSGSVELRRVEEKMREIRKNIPVDLMRRYDKLRRNGIAVTREIHGVCESCRLKIPLGDLNRMSKGRMDPVCPYCGLFVLLESRNPGKEGAKDGLEVTLT